MARFSYQALTSSGRLMEGVIEADSQETASVMLEQMQLTVSSIAKAPAKAGPTRIGHVEFMLFNQQLASIAKAGVPLERALREVVADVDSRAMRELIGLLIEDLEAGAGVDEAFARYKNVFPPLYGQIVKAGIQSGRLSEMLISLNRHLEVSRRTRRILVEAFTYPAVVLSLAALVMTAVFLTVVPQIEFFLDEFDVKLAGLTRLIVAMGHHVGSLWIGIGAIGVVGAVLWSALSASPGGRRFKEAICLNIPVLGSGYHRGLLSRLADAMALLVGAGCDLPTCLRLGSAATGSEILRLECERVAEHIERGEALTEATQLCPTIPPLFLYSMSVGSQRNELAESLYSMSDMYARQAETNQTRLQALLSPILLVLVGGVIGLVITAIFMPMVQMIDGMMGF